MNKLLDNIEVQKVLLGEKQLFSKVVETFEQDIYMFVKAFNIEEEIVISLVKDSFIYTYNHLHFYKETEVFSEWFATTIFSYLFKELERHFTDKEAPIQNATYKETFVFLLHDLLQVGIYTISKVLNNSVQDVEKELVHAHKHFFKEELEERMEKEGCLSALELFQYVKNTIEGSSKIKVEDHLEFCPSCRESVFSMKSLKATKLKIWRHQQLEADISQIIIDELIPYKKKKRSWKYQYLAAASVVALFSIFMFVVPNVVTWVSAASNYVKYGQFYNVWGSGTYAVEDRNIKLEVLHVEVSPKFLYVHYDVDNETKEKFFEQENYFGSLIQPWGNSTFQMKTKDNKTYNLGVSDMPPLKDGENVIILSFNSTDVIPDSFDLKLNVREIAHTQGNWELIIPIQYAPFKNDIEIVDINLKETFADSTELSIEQIIKTPLGSVIEYKVNLTDEEVNRIMDSLSEEAKSNGYDSSYLKNDVNPMLTIESADNFHLIPIHIYDNYRHNNPALETTTQKAAYSQFYYDPDELQALYEKGEYNPRDSIVKGRLTKEDTMYMVLSGFQYHVPIEFSIPIKLEEVDNMPLNLEVNGDVFETITIKKITLENDHHNPERFEITMKGSSHNKQVKNIYHWGIHEADDNSYEQRYINYEYGNEYNNPYEDDEVGFQFLVYIDDNTPEEAVVRTHGATRIIRLEEPLRIPLHINE